MRYLGGSLLTPFIGFAVFVLRLLASIREELAEHGWRRGTFKWLIIIGGLAFLVFLAVL
jgi:hypothetical protein